MKILVAVTNCWLYRKRQDVIRHTWLQNVPSEVDVKFFLGRPPAGLKVDNQDLQRPDEVFVDVSDDYNGLPAKTREMCRYAIANGYSHLFKTDDDVYLRLERLVASDFAQLGHYVGRKRGPSGNLPAPYASGFSYWLSTKAMKIIAEAKLTDDPAEDRWVGNLLMNAGIHCVPDYRYVVTSSQRNSLSNHEGPRKGNTIISACEFETDQEMLKMHNEFLNVPSVARSHQKTAPSPLHKVCIMLKTFLRDGYLMRAIDGIKLTMPEAKMVIVDDGFEQRPKISLYSVLRQDGHSCEWLPFDSGFGAKSNEAVKHCDREYVLIGSDDFAFGQNHVRADVERMVRTLDQTDLDVVSGRVNGRPYEATLTEVNDEVFERAGYHGPEEQCEAGAFRRCDLTVNYSLIRRSLLDRVHWDSDVKIGGGEHGMFFLDVQRAGGKVAYLPGVSINELPANVPGWFHGDYHNYRSRARAEGRPCAKRRGINRYHLMGGGVEVS